ncbi:MAG TPA: YtxH domain-containing protein [Cyclobacteriaceae bacterium]|nr:YtxH domain-containing protein [Cyclobacteriaceae bacterium]
MKRKIQMIGGLLVGVALGTAAGILMAPSSGRKTRRILLKKSKKIGNEFENAMRDSIGQIKSNYNKKVEEFGVDGINSIKSLKEKIKI